MHRDIKQDSQIRDSEQIWQEALNSGNYPNPLHSYIEHQVLSSPSSPAVSSGTAILSYEALNARANQLAHQLISLGVKPNTLVGICIDRSVDMLVGLLGILKAGGAYVPLDPEYPQNRLNYMLEDSGIDVLLTEDKYHALPASHDLTILCLDSDWESISSQSSKNPGLEIGPDDLAYLIYTSGSTGKPKGVMLSHKAIVNRLIWMQLEYKLGPEDRVLQKTPMSFDVSVWEFFWPLMTGAELVMARPGGHREPSYLVETILNRNITTLHFVPSMLNLFLSAPKLNDIKSLRQVFCSGEALPAELVRRFYKVSENAVLHNLYGPTEAAVDVSHWQCPRELDKNVVPIGKAISNIKIHILDENLKPLENGEAGELHIGGIGLAKGYWNRPELTAEKFIDDPFSEDPQARLYKSGDLARLLDNGDIEYLGRIDFQVKIRGLRIELGEIEAALLKHPAVEFATVLASEDKLGEKRLLAYVVFDKSENFSIQALRNFLLQDIPEYMLPSAFIPLDEMPLSPNGKVDRKALPSGVLQRPELNQAYIAPQSRFEKTFCKIWEDLLNMDRVGINDNFFDLGGNSLLCMMSVMQIEDKENIRIPLVKLFQYPTVHALAKDCDNKPEDDSLSDTVEKIKAQRNAGASNIYQQGGVAIVGMSGRFPGAYDVDELWEVLREGKETITFFDKEDLGPGLDPAITDDPNYVFARGIIPDGDKFDAAFFGVNPTEAKTIDPQQRVFLELSWGALENAGYTPEKYKGTIGVYAGMGNNYYYPLNVMQHTDIVNMVGPFPIMVGNEKDHIATRVANKLNLTGPAISVHTACSTALTAIDNAFFSLLTGQCDMALAGGISLQTPQYSGQLHQDGGVFSSDGHCRPFDAQAEGTLFSDSAGIVVLKRVDDAIKDGDTIYALIKSTALNNDGAEKISYLAPSISGQKEVIAMALARAGVEADSISYVEGHGTGTPIGDPIEIEALTQVYRRDTEKKQFCGIGSIKSNLGHPTIAAGVTGVIKVALALKNEKLPPTLHYKKANPKIDFENSPFYVVAQLQDWPRAERVRRGAVSSFGFGGTNGHAILEEAPIEMASGPSRPRQLIQLSAKSREALDSMSENLATLLESKPETPIADAAFTLQMGRSDFQHRRYLVCQDSRDACSLLRKPKPGISAKNLLETQSPELVFMFPGQGSQYINMGRNLYEEETLFRDIIDNCASILHGPLGCDLRQILYPEPSREQEATEQLKNTRYQQAAIFVIEYALAKLWNSWGIYPDFMIGHSIGEIVCACLANIFSLDDALKLIAERGRLMSEQAEGGMLSIRLPARDVENRMPEGLSLAASNGPSLCAVAGPNEIIDAFRKELEKEDIPSTLLHVSRAFHSTMMEPAVEPLCDFVRKINCLNNAPTIPIMSTMSAKWITGSEMCEPEYWGKQLRSPVRFAEAIQQIWDEPTRVLLEVGPRTVTSTLARQQASPAKKQVAISSLSDTAENEQEWDSLLNALGSLWLRGVNVDLQKFWRTEKRQRLSLPTYPFARKRYWLDPRYNSFTQKIETTAMPTVGSDHDKAANSSVLAAESGHSQSSTNQRLVAVLEDISGVEFGDDLDDSISFSELGLDSLFLTQIAFKLRSDFQVEVSFRQLTENFTSIALLVEYIESQHTGHSSPAANLQTEIQEPDEAPPANQNFLTPSAFQKEIFELIEKDGHEASCAHNEAISITLHGSNFNTQAMISAITMLVERHDAFQIRFAPNGKMLLLSDEVQIDVTSSDISSEPQPQEKLKEILKQDFVKAFDLVSGPLIRANIIKITEECHKVALTAHLVVCDGWSLDVLVEDLGHLYSSIVGKTKLRLGAAESFIEYMGVDISHMQSDNYKASHDYWHNKLAVLPAPIDYPIKSKTRVRSYNGDRADITIEPQIVSALKGISGQHGCSLYTILLGGLGLLFQGLSAQRKFVIGMPTAGQAINNKNHLVGNCLNYIPLIIDINAKKNFTELLLPLRDTVLEAVENARYHFGKHIKEATAKKARVPFIQACLNMSPKIEGDKLHYHELKAEYDVSPRYYESFELFINAVTDRDNTLTFQFQYCTDLFSAEDIEHWQTLLHEIFVRIARNPGERIANTLQALNLKVEKSDPSSFIKTIKASMKRQAKKKRLYPLHFGKNKELYGIQHLPKNPTGETAILFCYPIGQEYMKSHWAFRLLANALLKKGLPVLKFDYFGTGDSLGGTSEWNLDRWAEDVVCAAELLRKKSGLEKVSIVALRFGSIIAAKAMERGLNIEKLVLWNPIISGEDYLNALKEMHSMGLEKEKGFHPFPTERQLGVSKNEILGHIHTPELQESIKQAKLLNYSFANCKNIAITCSCDDEQYLELQKQLKGNHPHTEYYSIVEDVDWDDFQQAQNAVLPSGMINKITSLFGADNNG